jgi:hypothetical protein
MQLLQAQPDAQAPPGTISDDNGTPVVAKFKTNLRLTPDRVDWLTKRITDRINELRGEMGLEAGGTVTTNSWMWERQVNTWQAANQFDWREQLGGIFEDSNFSLNIAKRYARLMGAKTSDDLVGTDPFFAVMPNKNGTPETAKEVEWYLQEEVSRSNARDSIIEAQQIAIAVNECVVKCSYVLDATHFRGPATVMVDQSGQPFITPRGNYVYQKDDIIPDPDIQPGPDGQPQAFRLKKEPQVRMPPVGEAVFQYFEDLDQTLLGYQGLDIQPIDFRDFLCPLAMRDIHKADIRVHLLDLPYESLKATYGNFEVSEDYFDGTMQSGEKQPVAEKGEQESGSKVLKFVHCADVYIRCDADNDGMEEEIWMLFDLTNQKPIWFDYLGNHMKRVPFEVIPGIEKVKNRWYGVGVFEMLAHKQLYIDTQFNRVNFKSSKASSARFRNKNAVDQWKSGDEMVFGDRQVFDIIDPRFNASNPPLFQVNLSEIDPFAMELIKLMLQAGSTEVGVVGPNDGELAGLDTTKLATGIKSLERTGNVLMKYSERAHGSAITRILDQAMDIVIEHMDEDELVYREDTGALLALNREEVRHLTRDVRLLLTRSRSTETLETSAAVVRLCREYYESLTTFERYKLRGEYLRQLKALEVQDAGELLEEVTPEQLQAWVKQQSQPPVTPPKESIATKFGDLERPEQEQVLRSQGIQPASPAEVAQGAKQDVQQVGAEAKAKAAATPKTNSNGNSQSSSSPPARK